MAHTKSALMHRISHQPAGAGVDHHRDLGSIEAQREHEVALVRGGLLSIGESERIVLSLYYAEELTIEDIALVLKISASDVARLRADGLASIQASLAQRAT